jgi:uncharacterized protein (DUF1778 family)
MAARRKPKAARIEVRITTARKRVFQELADREGRSLANWIMVACEKAAADSEAPRRRPAAAG